MNIPNALGTTTVAASPWLLLNYVLESERFLKNKVSGEIAFDLISLFRVQEPTCRSSTMTAFVFLAKFSEFYYYKTFETRS